MHNSAHPALNRRSLRRVSGEIRIPLFLLEFRRFNEHARSAQKAAPRGSAAHPVHFSTKLSTYVVDSRKTPAKSGD
jgi:hypothetical protein